MACTRIETSFEKTGHVYQKNVKPQSYRSLRDGSRYANVSWSGSGRTRLRSFSPSGTPSPFRPVADMQFRQTPNAEPQTPNVLAHNQQLGDSSERDGYRNTTVSVRDILR